MYVGFGGFPLIYVNNFSHISQDSQDQHNCYLNLYKYIPWREMPWVFDGRPAVSVTAKLNLAFGRPGIYV